MLVLSTLKPLRFCVLICWSLKQPNFYVLGFSAALLLSTRHLQTPFSPHRILRHYLVPRVDISLLGPEVEEQPSSWQVRREPLTCFISRNRWEPWRLFADALESRAIALDISAVLLDKRIDPNSASKGGSWLPLGRRARYSLFHHLIDLLKS